MDIFKGASEKISIQNREGQYHTREFSASRKVTLPDDAKPTLIRLEEVRLDLELKKQLLTNFLLEGVITSEQMETRLQPYKDLLDKADEAHNPSPF